MISLLLGPPGGGKSYEAVVFHVLAAIENGRKVITNLPINVAEVAKIEPRATRLLELRTRSRVEGARPFSVVEDYGDDWRDPDTGQGALYVIDEAHKAVPRRGYMSSEPKGKAVDEWYAEHRHEGCDVLLITQSYGKLSKDIVDQVQVVYRVKKMTLFGDSSKYLRKVQDGVKGDVMSQTEREYQPRYFKLYKSHTRTESSVIESDAQQITPAHLKWKRASILFLSLGGVLVAWTVFGFFRGDDGGEEAPGARTEEHAGEPTAPSRPPDGPPIHQGVPGQSPTVPPASPPLPPVPIIPPDSPTMRLVGVVAMPGGKAHAMIHMESGQRRVSLRQCSSTWPDGWSCIVDGQRVTSWTGPQPETVAASLYASFAPEPE